MRPADSLIAEKDAQRAENEISEIKDYSHHWLDSWAASGLDGGKRTTNDMYVLDIHKIARAGLSKAGCSFRWQRTRGGEKIASIGLRTETDRVVLDYRSRSNGDEWQNMNYPVFLDWTGCHYRGQRAWWRCPAVGGVWRCCTGARCMRAGIATSWPTKPSESNPMTGQAVGRTRSANGWAGLGGWHSQRQWRQAKRDALGDFQSLAS